MLGNFLKIDKNVLCFPKIFKICLILMSNDTLSGKQVGSQASLWVTQRLAWIQPVCISINAVPALKGLTLDSIMLYSKTPAKHTLIYQYVQTNNADIKTGGRCRMLRCCRICDICTFSLVLAFRHSNPNRFNRISTYCLWINFEMIH